MAYTQLLQNSETLYGPFLLRKTLLMRKREALQDGILLPDDFIAAVESYAERNLISAQIGNTGRIQKELCPHCLKAFILHTAEQHELSEEAKILLEELFHEESLGHSGYFLDKDEVRAVQIRSKQL